MRVLIAVDIETDDPAVAQRVVNDILRHGYDDLDEENFGVPTNGVEVEVL